MLHLGQCQTVLLATRLRSRGYEKPLQAAAPQTRVGRFRLVACASSVPDKPTPDSSKVDYRDVVNAWTQSFKMVDQSKEEEAEIVKNRLREALKPEKLLEIVEKHTNDPKTYFTIVSTDSSYRVCNAACKSIEAEGFLPKELHVFAASGDICVGLIHL